jgi:methylated-DNA-protein-cysteine methyltransferase related protein
MPKKSAPTAANASGTMHDSASRILAVVRSIPRGRVSSYGQIAARAGLHGRARLVAWALKQETADAPVPWHRVLRSSGHIAFPEGSASFAEQLRLLKREKVKVLKGRVSQAQFAWRDDDLDASLWRMDT